jgi:acetoacetyl-CoA synthetase
MNDSDLRQKTNLSNDTLSVEDHLSLWEHPAPESTRIHLFKENVNRKFDVKLNDYKDLYGWSIRNPARFWEEVWIFTSIRASVPFHETSHPRAFDESAPMFPRPAFFQGTRLNFAENLLFPTCVVDEDSLAVIAATEVSREYVSWKELRERVRQCAASMRAIGISKGDRVAGFLANHTNTLTAMLSATSLGALWTGVSPDTGVHAVLERLVQIEPKLLFADNAVVYNSKVHDTNGKVCQIVRKLPGLEGVVIFDSVSGHQVNLGGLDIPDGRAWTYSDFVELGDTEQKLEFAQLEPDHPVYILYSSGTTGSKQLYGGFFLRCLNPSLNEFEVDTHNYPLRIFSHVHHGSSLIPEVLR